MTRELFGANPWGDFWVLFVLAAVVCVAYVLWAVRANRRKRIGGGSMRVDETAATHGPDVGPETRGPTACPVCTGEILADDRFCGHCGHDLVRS